MNVVDGDYDREGLALYVAGLLPKNNLTEAHRVLTLAGKFLPLIAESCATPVSQDDTDDSMIMH